MATLKLASYGPSVAIFGNAELASLPAGDYAWGAGGGLTSNVWDNTTLLYPVADFLLKLGSITPTVTAQTVNLHIAWSIDGGTTYPDPQLAANPISNANLSEAGLIVGWITLQSLAQAHIAVFKDIPLLPGKAKFILSNNAVTFSALNNSLVMYPKTWTIS